MRDGSMAVQDEYSPFVDAARLPNGRESAWGTPPNANGWSTREDEHVNPDAAELSLPGDHEDEGAGWEYQHGGGDANKPVHSPACTASGIGIRGTDDRVPVADATAIPFRWICQLWIRQRDSNGKITTTGATGVLISPRHVLTVAHAISSSERDSRNQVVTKEAIDIRVSPGRDGQTRPFGTVDVKLPARVSPNWSARTMPPQYDYALLTLDTAVGDKTFKTLGGKKLCYWGAKSCGHRAIAARVPPATLNGATAETAGYPKDRGNGEAPHRTTGVLSNVVESNRLMHYSADACQGQSGSPVWVEANGEIRLVGMLVKVLAPTTLALRVTRELATQLRKWLGKDSDAFTHEVTTPSSGGSSGGSSGSAVREWETDHGEAEGERGGTGTPCACGCRRVAAGGRAAEHEDGESEGGEREWMHAEDENAWEASASESFADTMIEGERDVSDGEFDVSASEAEFDLNPAESEASEDETAHAPEAETTDGEWESSFGSSMESPEQQVARPRSITLLPFMADLAAPLDPGFYNASGQYVTTPALQTLVDAVGALPVARTVQMALVDLSAGVASPVFAGVRHTAPTAMGSVGKLFPMYAAFQLQTQLRALRAATGAVTAADLWTRASDRWVATQRPAPGTAVTAIAGHLGRQGDLVTWKGRPITLPGGSTLPHLHEIFGDDIAVKIRSGVLSYVSTTTACDEFAVLLNREHARTSGQRDLPFMQRMRMMVGLSDNIASGSCIDDLGFAYIASLMVQAGFWHPARGGGVWLAGNYAGRGWRQSPLGGFVQNGTAGAVASLMTLLAQDRLVDAASSAAMRSLLLKGAYPGAGTRSPVRQTLDSIAGRHSKVHSKLGLLPGTVSDAAIVERTEGGKTIRYAVAILSAPGDAAMRQIAAGLDNCIRRLHGLP